MPVIPLNMPNAPTFSASNALMAQAAQLQQAGFRGLQDTLKGTQTAIRDKNTDALMTMLNQARTTDQFNGQEFQSGLTKLQESMRGEYNTKEFQTRLAERPDQLLNRDVNTVRLTEGQNILHDNPLINRALQERIRDPKADVSEYTNALRGNAAQVFGQLDGLATSAQQRDLAMQANSRANQAQTWAANAEQRTNDLFPYQLAEAQNTSSLGNLRVQAANGLYGDGGGGTTTSAQQANGSPLQVDKNISQWDPLVAKYSDMYGVPTALIRAVMKQESGGDKNAKSGQNAHGLMQLLPTTAARFTKNTDLYDPDNNINASTQYLSYLMKLFKNDERKVIAAYHAGEGNVQKWVNGSKDGKQTWEQRMRFLGKDGKLGNPNTVNYVDKVTANLENFRGTQKQAAKLIRAGQLDPVTAAVYVPDKSALTQYAAEFGNLRNDPLTQSIRGAAPEAAAAKPSKAASATAVPTSTEQLKIANDYTKALTVNEMSASKAEQETLASKSGISQNLGAYSSLKEWAQRSDVGYRARGNIISLVGSDDVVKKLSMPQRIALAETLAKSGEVSKDRLETLRNSTIKQFLSANAQNKIRNASLIELENMQKIQEAQTKANQEAAEKRQAELRSFIGF